jgi:Spy/CpxP family protein refolding chaperone
MTDPATRPARWLKVALVLSLGLNLLVIAAVIGAALGAPRMHDRMRGEVPREFGRSPLVSALAAEDRRAVARELRRAAEPLRENRADLRGRFERLLEAIRAEPFDRAALEALLGAQREAGARRLKIAEAALLARLEAMSPEARAAYAARLDASLRRGP